MHVGNFQQRHFLRIKKNSICYGAQVTSFGLLSCSSPPPRVFANATLGLIASSLKFPQISRSQKLEHDEN